MRLIHNQLGIQLEFKENIVNELIIESPIIMVDLIEEMRAQCLGDEGNWVLSDDETLLSIKKCVSLVLEPFSLECNSKRVLSKIYQNLEKEQNQTKNLLRADFNEAFFRYVESICMKSDIPLTYCTEMDFSDILKLAKVQVDLQTGTFLERIMEHIRLEVELFGTKLFVFLHLKSYLNDNDIELLYQECFYKKVQLLLLESNDMKKMKNENICIIDKDCCLIYL